MIKVDEAKKTLKFFQYGRIYLSDDDYHLVEISSNIYCKNDQTKVFNLNNIKFTFTDVDRKAGNI